MSARFDAAVAAITTETKYPSKIVFICFAARFYFFKLSRSLSAKPKDLNKINKSILELTGNRMKGWIDSADNFKSNNAYFKRLAFYNKEVIINKEQLHKRTFQRCLEELFIDVKTIRYEGIRDFYQIATNSGMSHQRSISVLSRITGLTGIHISCILSGMIHPTGNKKNGSKPDQKTLQIMLDLFEHAKYETDPDKVSSVIEKVERIECAKNDVLSKQLIISQLNEHLISLLDKDSSLTSKIELPFTL